MRVLFDQGTPVPQRSAFESHRVSTAFELGWSDLGNGELLAAAEDTYDVLVTTDKNLRHQQNMSGRELAILVLPTTSWPKLRGHAERIVAAVEGLRAGQLVELEGVP